MIVSSMLWWVPHFCSILQNMVTLTAWTRYYNTNSTHFIFVIFKGFIDIVGAINFCKTNPDTDKDVYRNFVAGQIVAFMK